MKKQYLLGIDIGTSACKMVVFSKDGNVLAVGAAGYSTYYPYSGWAEQNPDEWWNVVCKTVPEVLQSAGIMPEEIAGIGIDGQGWTAIAVDKEGDVLARTPIWLDRRTQDICDRLNEKVGKEKIFDLCGNVLRPYYTTAKVLWYEENQPEVYDRIWKILQSNSFIAYRFTDRAVQDLSQAYGWHCFDMRKGCWDIDMCKALGIPTEFLPEIVPCHEVIGVVTEEAAMQTGLVPGIPVVAGGLDAACGTFGAGVIHSGETQEQGGQAGGMSICMDTYAGEPRLILGYHVVPGKWLLQGGTTGGGGAMRWLEQELGDYERCLASTSGKTSLEQFNEKAKDIEVGSDGLVFLPYMAGERSPVWNTKAKGGFFGLDFAKTKGHMIRAVMEGVAFSLKHNLDVAGEAGAIVNQMVAVGGSANSDLWMQIKSDVTGKVITVPFSDAATTLGAAMLAGVGIGMYADFEDAVKQTVKITKRYEPNMENHLKYQKNYQEYLKLSERFGVENNDRFSYAYISEADCG